QPLQSKLLAAAAYIAPPTPSLPPLPERRTLSLLHLPRRTIPGIPRRRLPGPLLPRPYSESLSLRTPRPPLNHISDQNQDGVGRTLTKIEYPSEYEVRRVDPSGGFRWRGASIYATRALAGEWIGLEAIDEERWRVHFSFYGIGELIGGASAVRMPKASKSPLPHSGSEKPRNP